MTVLTLTEQMERMAARVAIPGAEPYFLPGSTGTAVLALHGWSASAESLRFLAQGMAAAGHAVMVPTLPGHGTSAGDMVRFGPLDWVAAAREALELLRPRFQHIVVLGVSMGGALALQLAGSTQIDAVVTVNAPIFMDRPSFAQEIVSASDRPLEGWRVPAFFGPEVPEISYPERQKKSGSDLYAMCALAREVLPLISAPLLAFQSVLDPVVPKACADEIIARAGSAQKQVVWLDQSYHVSQLDIDRDRIVSATLDFIHQSVAA